MKTKIQFNSLVLAACILIPMLQACGPGGFQSASWQESETKDYPEPHGPMNIEPIYDEPAAELPRQSTPSGGSIAIDGGGSEGRRRIPVPRISGTIPGDEPATSDGSTGSSSGGLLCQDKSPNTPLPEGLNCPWCFKGEYTQKSPGRPKLDILFVADTSPSLATERGAIAAGIRQFFLGAHEFTGNIDYRIAVMPAHSDESYDDEKKPSTGLAGTLVASGGHPKVLSSETFGSDWNSLTRVLTERLMGLSLDKPSDGGELGLFSLNYGITARLQENKAADFFRDDAALAVIFISDENDLCSYGHYPPGVTPAVNEDRYGDMSVEEKASQFYCQGGNGKAPVTAQSVYDKLRNIKAPVKNENNELVAQPILISGIHYTGVESVPTTPAPDEQYPQYFHENEVGYGYLDLIRKDGNGVAVDISLGNFNEGLKKIGEAAGKKLEVKETYKLDKKAKQVDEKTVCVLVDGKEAQQLPNFATEVEGMSYVYTPESREVQIRGIGATNSSGEASTVQIFFCEPPELFYLAPEVTISGRKPTRAEHYNSVLKKFPEACTTVRQRILSGDLAR